MNCAWCRKPITDHYQTLEIRIRQNDQLAGYIKAHYPTCAYEQVDQVNNDPTRRYYLYGHQPKDIRADRIIEKDTIENPFDDK